MNGEALNGENAQKSHPNSGEGLLRDEDNDEF